ncbi:MAG: hypothetical protein DWQ37_23260 [Planctomycetota bacterium]|nr:MAG: hypothetical protein DWQ37_23260 [Planctomycetota bacterium]
MSDAPKRHWFRYSLRTLLVLAAIFGCWLGYQANWIRQRRAAVGWMATQAEHWHHMPIDQRPYFETDAPWTIRLWGEQGLSRVGVVVEPEQVDAKQRELERLFPEADGILVLAPGPGYGETDDPTH